MTWDYNKLLDEERLLPADPDQVRRVMLKKDHKGFWLYDLWARLLTYNNCYEAVVLNGTRTIVIARRQDIEKNGNELLFRALESLRETRFKSEVTRQTIQQRNQRSRVQ